MRTPHLYIRLLTLWTGCAALLLLAACSTTSAIPEGEQLYTGIKAITYGQPQKSKPGKAERDSTGVITSVANAVNAVDHLLEGNASDVLPTLQDLKAQNLKQMTRQERKQYKAERAIEEDALAVAKEEVEAVLAYAPNNSLFGSSSLTSPLKFGLWTYNKYANTESKWGKWMFKHFATQPILVSNVAPETRAKVATNTLHNYGFFRGKVAHEVLTESNPKKAQLAYNIQPGPVYRLDSIAYLGFDAPMQHLLDSTAHHRLLRSGDAFSVLNLSGEQARIETLMRENGYYYYTAPMTTFEADTIARPLYAALHVRPVADRPAQTRHPWYMGDTYITIRNQQNAPLDKTQSRRGYTFTYAGDKMPLRQGMWRRAISHRKGKLYRLSDQKLTLEKLAAIGVFSSMDVSYVPRDTTESCDTLDLYVSATMDKLYDSAFEMNATMKSNQQIGPGVSYELAKRNAFRGGERVSFKILGSYEWQMGSGSEGGNSLLNSYELGAQLAFEFPRFVFPGISRRHTRFPASTVFAFDADWKNRSGFFNMVTMGLSATYKWHKHPNALHELTLLNLEFNQMLHTTPAFDEITTANPALYVSMRDQFVPSMGYTFTYTAAETTRRALWLQLSVKEAGNIVSGIYKAAGKAFNTHDKSFLGSPFAQFLKFTAEVHHTLHITPSVQLATRFFGGIVASYGNSLHAPYAEQFYVGGANSVRAFTVRTIGPGRFRSPESKYAYIDQTGDIKLEANAEVRARLFGSLHGAVFVDVGNVWLMRDDPLRPDAKFSAANLRHLAVGTGAGLRYDLEFLVLRFDVGIGLHAPYKTSRTGFYNLERFKDGLAFHFAIGYPF